MRIEIKDLHKNFGKFEALAGVNLDFPSGDLVALLGPSGSGKTTLLRMLAGLEAPDSGTIFMEGRDTTGDHVQNRQVGFVFQHYALFKHMTIFDNVAFGLRVKSKLLRPSESEIRLRVLELLRLVQLDWLADRYPSQLSGGQRQRIALARALAVQPRLLLLDEPFGALDAKVRVELRHWLRRLHDDLGITTVFVTHDQEEAMEVADRVVILNHGLVEQVGTPEEVYERPGNPFVYEFLGLSNSFHGDLRQEVLASGLDVRVTEHDMTVEKGAHAYVRPYDFEVTRDAPASQALCATLRHAQPLGNVVRLQFDLPGRTEPIRVELDKPVFRELQAAPGGKFHLRPKHVQIFLKDRKDEAAWFGK